jgi:SCY1-like protein 1
MELNECVQSATLNHG